ncbi:MAG: hypothetical protein E6I70_00910 [Chloroflexi bacterium]|nr:MAG: hypothetical protein E6I70_00910 [Chloroflexota bacterium]
MPKIGVRLPASFDSAGEFLADAQALEAAGAELLTLGEGDLEPALLLAALASVTTRIALHGAANETLRQLARGRLALDLEGWVEEALPADRGAWRVRLAAHDEAGVAGVIVPMNPRLVGLLRNPDVEDDRAGDLQLAQG